MQPTINFIEMISSPKIPGVLVGTWIVMAILIVVAALCRSALARVADPVIPEERISLTSIAEVVVEQLDSFVAGVMEMHGYRAMVPFLGSLFLFILAANFFGLIPGMEAPTSDSNLTFALGAICFFYYICQGFKAKGLGYLRSFLGPLLVMAPLMLPIEIADNLFRPFSLGVRLGANMYADHQVLGIFTNLTKLIIPVALYALGSIVCMIQALIFMVLTMGYVKMTQGHH